MRSRRRSSQSPLRPTSTSTPSNTERDGDCRQNHKHTPRQIPLSGAGLQARSPEFTHGDTTCTSHQGHTTRKRRYSLTTGIRNWKSLKQKSHRLRPYSAPLTTPHEPTPSRRNFGTEPATLLFRRRRTDFPPSRFVNHNCNINPILVNKPETQALPDRHSVCEPKAGADISAASNALKIMSLADPQAKICTHEKREQQKKDPLWAVDLYSPQSSQRTCLHSPFAEPAL